MKISDIKPGDKFRFTTDKEEAKFRVGDRVRGTRSGKEFVLTENDNGDHWIGLNGDHWIGLQDNGTVHTATEPFMMTILKMNKPELPKGDSPHGFCDCGTPMAALATSLYCPKCD